MANSQNNGANINECEMEHDKTVLHNIPRGKPVSGRVWKSTRSDRHSELTLQKPLKTSWKLKMQQKAEKKNIKAFELELKEAKTKELQEKRRRTEEKKKLKEEMTKRAEVTQTIKNPAKLKRVRKKALRAAKK